MSTQSDIKKLEEDLWASADLLRANANLNASEYCMPVLGLLFLKYAYGRYKKVEAELMKNRPSRGGRVMPITKQDFQAKSALFLPREAQYDYLLNLPENVASANIVDEEGRPLSKLGDVVNYAMRLIEQQSDQLKGILPSTYDIFTNEILFQLLRIFNNDKLEKVGGDIIGRIYEYFTGKFSKSIADADGVFFTPKSLVQMIVNIIEPKRGTVLDPACGSGGMFIQSGDFVNDLGMNANSALTFYGQEKVEFNARLCLMNMAVHGLNAKIKSGNEANTYSQDAHNLVGCCDYVMANPPFNVSGVEEATVSGSSRLPFGLPGVNKEKKIGNANYLWIQYFYAYLKSDKGRAGFVMASSATDSQNKDKLIREQLVRTGHVDCLVSVGNNFFYTLSLPCTLWFFDKAKREENSDKILFIDARNYYTVVDKTLNEWNEWQMRNLNAIVWLYRGETDRYRQLISDYRMWLNDFFTRYDSYELQPSNPTWEKIRSGILALLALFKGNLKEHEAQLKATKKKADRAPIAELVEEVKGQVAEITEALEVATQLVWLTDKFGDDGEYKDIPGLCRIASIDEVEAKQFSLTPGAYVGVPENEDDGIDFAERMREIHSELARLNTESNALMADILKNMEEMKL